MYPDRCNWTRLFAPGSARGSGQLNWDGSLKQREGFSFQHGVDNGVFPLCRHPGTAQGETIKSCKPTRARRSQDVEVPSWNQVQAPCRRAQVVKDSTDDWLTQ